MKRTKLIIITVILSVVLLAVQTYIVKTGSEYEAKVKVVFAKEYIPANTEITEDMLEMREVNIGLAHLKSVTNAGKLIGKKTKMDIEAKEMILESKIYKENELMEKIAVKNDNNRLFTLELKGDQANGWWIEADQYVDILFVPTQKPEERKVERMEKIRVAALISQEGKLIKNNIDRNVIPKYICLEVDTKQDELLAFAKGNGRIELSVIPSRE
ncbi:MAG TPA: SAF domain-containing protein [Clostridiales bacterium]|nr:SAF domain-containing protein [Clostridiales bacterium]